MIKRKAIKNLSIIGFLSILFIPFTVSATEIDDITDLSGVLTGSTANETTITLTQNVDLGDNSLEIIGGDYIIDLNGYKITSTASNTISITDANVTINDTSTNKTGTVETTKVSSYSTYAIWAYIGTNLTINGGTFIGSTGAYYYNYSLNNEFIINDGTFESNTPNTGLVIRGGTVVINKAVVKSKVNYVTKNDLGISVNCSHGSGLDLTINDVVVSGTMGMLINVDNNYTNYDIKINGGTYTGTKTGLYILGNAVPYTKISGGHFKATSTNASDNPAGIDITKSVNGAYNLNTLLNSNSKYSSTVFGEYQYTIDDRQYYNITTVPDVYVGKESNITIKNGIINGTISAPKTTAVTNEEVALTVTPAAGYKLKSISVLDINDENPITVTNNKFIMPNHNVYISAEFEVDYSFFEISKGQTYRINKDNKLTFKLNPSYDLFEDGGKVYVDSNLVDSSYIASSPGSTIITFSKAFLDELAEGEHTIKVVFNTDVEVSDRFTIETYIKNPNTSDGIISLILMGIVSLFGVLGCVLFLNKEKRYN